MMMLEAAAELKSWTAQAGPGHVLLQSACEFLCGAVRQGLVQGLPAADDHEARAPG